MANRLPILILAGSDQRRSTVPDGLEHEDMLHGYKGAIPLRSGRPLVQELVDRIVRSDYFQAPILVGPERVYADIVDCDIVDAEGNLANTLQRTVDTMRRRFGSGTPIAVATCDILPTPDELVQLIRDDYGPHRAAVFWGQLIEARPDQMGASAWKPSYGFRAASDQPPLNLYPGHLVIVRPQALRFELTIRLLQLVYAHRNQKLQKRVFGVLMRSLGILAAADLRNLRSCQMPVLTFTVPYSCLRAYGKYRRRRATIADFEAALATSFVHRRFRHQASNRPVIFSLTRMVSFAKDIDTKAELDEAQA